MSKEKYYFLSGELNIAKREDIRKKIGDGNRGKVRSKECIERIIKTRRKNMKKRGYYHSKETLEKIRQSNLGKHIPSLETLKKIKESNIGKKQSLETREKRRCSMRGKNKGLKSNETKLKISISTRKGMNNEITRQKLRNHRAKQILPTKDTSIERKIQGFLKQLNVEFYTHQYIKEIGHRYQCDIFIPSLNLVIECDGNYWHKYPTGRDIDHVRTKELIEKGFKVLRLWECEIVKMGLDDFEYKIKGDKYGHI